MRTLLSTALLLAMAAGACGAASAQLAEGSQRDSDRAKARSGYTFTNEDLPAHTSDSGNAPTEAEREKALEPPRPVKEIAKEEAGVEVLVSSTRDKAEHSSGEYHELMLRALQGFEQRLENLREEQRQRDLLDKAAQAGTSHAASAAGNRDGSS